jgi:AcrR family transcriptional regulator
VVDATLDTTAALVAEHGLRSVTMSQIAEQTGIGRATLYKYFPDVEAILLAWHERQVTGHLDYLAEVRDRLATPASDSMPCCRRTRSLPTSPTGTTTATSRHSCIETSGSPERSSSSAT